ncbi:ATP-NAD kinase [Halomarina pelagica]|uniref:ATP-NAD kinase n=1 Tax=Halomarina pelagica TaxID=2961599 RepID=UPI0020C36B68|nr:ATP-NAD kinase [Halomarina sp. BND7]
MTSDEGGGAGDRSTDPDGVARVGVPGSVPGSVTSAIEDADAEYVAVSPDDLPPDLDAVVAVGEGTVLSLAPDCRTPILAVDADSPLSVPLAAVDEAIATVAAGAGRTVEVPVVAARHAGGRTHALMDVMLVAASPARISEYSVESGGRTVARFRADGVVVATPFGSHGYARAAGGPALALGSGVAAVVPVAPFAIDPDRWVLPLGTVTLRVERDEAAVELLADDRSAGPVAPNDPVRVEPAGSLRFLATDGRGLERH